MLKHVTRENLEWLEKQTPEVRREVFLKNFMYYAAYCFPHYMHSAFSGFHYEMGQDIHDLLDGRIDELAWLGFRESAKTSLAKIFLIYILANELEEYVIADSLDLSNSESLLFEVAFELTTNARLIDTYGELYKTSRTKDQMTKKRQRDFILEDQLNEMGQIVKRGARVEAKSTGEPARGFVHGSQRPSFILLDDIENMKSIKSEALTRDVQAHLRELTGGLSTKSSRKMYLGNYISEFGVMQSVIDRAGEVIVHATQHPLIEKLKERAEDYGNKKLRVRIIPVCDGELPVNLPQNADISKYLHTPTWPERWTIEEVEGMASVVGKRRQMWQKDTGDRDFLAEFLCQPVDESLSAFRKEWFQDFELHELRKKSTIAYVTFDTPSRKEGEVNVKSDDCGISIVWIDAENHWYIKSWGETLGPTQIVNKIFEIYDFLMEMGTPAMKFGWEDTAFTRGLEPLFKMEKMKRNKFITMEWLTPRGRNKQDRIRTALLGRYEMRMMHHLKGESAQLETQLLRFPNSKKDDIVDSLAYISELSKPVDAERHGEMVRSGERKRQVPNKDYYVERGHDYDDEDKDSIYSLIGL